MVLLDPKGPIGDAERFVILMAIGLMLIVVIPVLVMAWSRHRISNDRAWAKKLFVSSVLSIMMSIDVTAPATSEMHLNRAPRSNEMDY